MKIMEQTKEFIENENENQKWPDSVSIGETLPKSGLVAVQENRLPRRYADMDTCNFKY